MLLGVRYNERENNKTVIRSDEGLTLETSAFRISVRWPIYIINSVDKTKFLNKTVTLGPNKVSVSP